MATAKTPKAPNYTVEQTAKIVADYVANPVPATVEALAQAMNKTTRSIIAKLSREGVYKAKEYKTKTGETPIKKDEHADAIGVFVNLSEGEIDSLTKANKSALRKICEKLAEYAKAETAEDTAEGETEGETE